jgi:hypothetical protein
MAKIFQGECMRRPHLFFLSLVLLCACPAFAQSELVVDVFIDMNGAAVGAQTSPSTMSAGTKGSGISWQINDSVAAMRVGPQRMSLPAPVRVGNTTYPVNYAHQSLQYDTSFSFNTYRGFLNGNRSALTASGFITLGIPDQGGSGSLSDLVRVHFTQGAGAVMQLYNGNGPGYVLNIEKYGGNTTHSSKIPVTRNQTYWYSFRVGGGQARLNVYSLPNFTLVGSTQVSTASGTIEYIGYGNNQEAAAGSRGDNFNYFEVSLIDWTNAAFPLVPSGPSDDDRPSPPTNLTINIQ